MSISILPAERPYVIDSFALLTDSEDNYVSSVLRTNKKIPKNDDLIPINVGWAHQNPYKALERLAIDAFRLREASAYKCPFLEQTFQSVVPTYLLTQHPHNYQTFAEHYARDIFSDAEFMRQHMFPKDDNPRETLSSIASTMMGPGYTGWFHPDDGGHSLEDAHVVLSNGDLLMICVWHWYNK
jgi:hypothetical protein